MTLLSGAEPASSSGEYCHFCMDRRADRRDIEKTSSRTTDPERFKHSKKPRLMANLWDSPLSMITDELHVRLRCCKMLLDAVEAEVFHRNSKATAQELILTSVIACGVSHFRWFDKAGGAVPIDHLLDR